MKKLILAFLLAALPMLGMAAGGSVELDDADIETAAETFVNPFTGKMFVHDLSANYQINDRFSIYGGVNNLAGRDPILTSISYPVSPAGRTFFFGVNAIL